jgi:hypothetical protein
MTNTDQQQPIEPEVTSEDIARQIESILGEAERTLEDQKDDYDDEHDDDPEGDEKGPLGFTRNEEARDEALSAINGVLSTIEDIRGEL